MSTKAALRFAVVGFLLMPSLAMAQGYAVECRFGGIVRWADNTAEWRVGGTGTEDIDGEGEWDAVAAAIATYENIPGST